MRAAHWLKNMKIGEWRKGLDLIHHIIFTWIFQLLECLKPKWASYQLLITIITKPTWLKILKTHNEWEFKMANYLSDWVNLHDLVAKSLLMDLLNMNHNSHLNGTGSKTCENIVTSGKMKTMTNYIICLPLYCYDPTGCNIRQETDIRLRSNTRLG